MTTTPSRLSVRVGLEKPNLTLRSLALDNNSFNELKNALQKKCDDKRAAMAKEVADRVAERRSAELYDVIYAGG